MNTIRKIKNAKPVSEYMKQHLADKNALVDAIQSGINIETVAKERGIKFVKPL